MLINLKKYILSITYKSKNCSFDVDDDFWEDLVDMDLEEVDSNV